MLDQHHDVIVHVIRFKDRYYNFIEDVTDRKRSKENLKKGYNFLEKRVEDEAQVLAVNRALLEKLGYKVIAAETGQKAVELARKFEGKIDLALLDIVLPDMEGRKVYPLIKEARPEMKVIVCSGYALEGPVQEILNAGAQAFIQKPFSLKTLSDKLKEVIILE